MGKLAEMQRKLLEQMMGAEAMGATPVNIHFSDPKVCRNFLCGICPHDLFSNTKMDLGPCPKTHSEKLKIEYEAAVKEDREGKYADFPREYEHNIREFVGECDRRIRAAHKRLEKTPEENNKTTALMREIGEIQTALDQAMQDVEALGEAGKVEESMKELAKVEALKEEKQGKERELQQLTETSGASGHQKLRVCDICGAYLSVLDSDRRLADHFGGKMHLGYLELRKRIDAFDESRNQRGPASAPHPLSMAAHPLDPAHANGARPGPPGGPPPIDSLPPPAPPPGVREDPRAGGPPRAYEDRDRDDRRSGYDDRGRDYGDRRERDSRSHDRDRYDDRRDRYERDRYSDRRHDRSRSPRRERSPDRRRY